MGVAQKYDVTFYVDELYYQKMCAMVHCSKNTLNLSLIKHMVPLSNDFPARRHLLFSLVKWLYPAVHRIIDRDFPEVIRYMEQCKLMYPERW